MEFSPDPSHNGPGGPLTIRPVVISPSLECITEVHTQQLAEALPWLLSSVERAIMVGKAK